MRPFESKTRHNEVKEKLIKILLFCAAAVSVLTTFGVLFSILFEAIEFFQLRSFWYFISATEWSPGVEDSKFGALAIFSGTFIIF